MAYHDEDEFRLGRSNGGRAQYEGGGGRRFAILRCAKIKNLGNMGASLQHTFRERETPNADPARIRDNTVLVGAEDSRGVLDAWHARAPEKIRSNAVHGLEYFIGGSPRALNAMSREDQDAYFRRALDWLEERHGKENVLSAVIHRDEATPHMTVMTIPLDDRGRLNARALVGDRGKLSAMQTDFAEQVGRPHGLERGVQGSKATHERVKSAYAHLNDPEHAVELPERRTGNFLGRGKEKTDAEWRRRASEAATGALVGAWSAMRREQRAHEVNILSLERQTIGTPSMKHQLDRLERQNRGLSRALESRTDEAHRLQRDLRHMQIGRDTALTYTKAVMQRAGIDETKVLPRMQEDIAKAIAAYDAQVDAGTRSLRQVPLAVPRKEVTRTLRQTEATTAQVPSQQTEATVQQEHSARQRDKGEDWGDG
ncbi:MobV family relaxase [Paracoccus sphaerophysae]|uniref:MobV family relaxase n=1 Tax=Paracoccus sphaerophysae TaxID=690417 RepID=UPI00068F7CFE|nr:MobV family relaxase [Paracoccus sphaerophysae]